MSINAQPFDPAFKLVGTLEEGQVLAFDVSENAFVNAYTDGTTANANVATITTITNTGAGAGISAGVVGSTLSLKSLVEGPGITITDNGDSLVIESAIVDHLQTGTNLGSGAPVFAQVNTSNQLEFKSIAGGTGVNITDDGQTITVNIDSQFGQGTFLEISNNLSDLTDMNAARNTLGVMSIAEAQGSFIRTDASSLPEQDRLYDIGSPLRRYNDIYAETFQGTATLADNLTITGPTGSVLVYDGNRWVAGNVPTVSGNTGSTFSGDYNDLANTPDLSGYLTAGSLTNEFVSLTSNSHPDVDKAYDIGTPQYRYNDIYAETFQGTATLADNLTITGNVGDFLRYDGTRWEAGQGQTLTLNGTILELSEGNSVDLSTMVAGDWATTSYVDNAISDVVGLAPATLDTLQELSEAIGNDPAFLNNITSISSDLQDEIDRIEVGAGLDASGSYVADFTTNYLQSATSLKDADKKLDAEIKALNDTVAGLSGGSTGTLANVAYSGDYNDLINKPVGTGGGSAMVETFKINYATDGTVSSISDASTGISGTTVASSAGGLVEIEFNGYNFPPAGTMIYGYVKATNEYVVTPVTKDMTTRKLSGGTNGDSFGNLGNAKFTLTLTEANTGASRTFGSTTHAWVMLTMVG